MVEKFEKESLMSLQKLQNYSTLNIFAVVTDIGTHGYEGNLNEIFFYKIKIIDQSIIDFNNDKDNTKKVEYMIVFKGKADTKFRLPIIHQVGDIIMIKRGIYRRVDSKEHESYSKFEIRLQMTNTFNFGFWMFNCSSKSDYLSYSYETNGEYKLYKLSDYDKKRIYEMRQFVYIYYKSNLIKFYPEFNKKVHELSTFQLNYFDLCVRIKSVKIISSNKLIFEMEDDQNDMIELKTELKYNRFYKGDLCLVKFALLKYISMIYSETKTQIVSGHKDFHILKIPRFFLSNIASVNEDSRDLVDQYNPHDIFHIKNKVVKIPDERDWMKIDNIRFFEVNERIFPVFEEKICRMKVMFQCIDPSEPIEILKLYCRLCDTTYQFNIDRICPKCLKENKVIYDFSLVGKEDVYSTHFFRFKVNSVDGNAETFWTGFTPDSLAKNIDKDKNEFINEIERLFTFLNYVWILVEITRTSQNLNLRIIGNYMNV